MRIHVLLLLLIVGISSPDAFSTSVVEKDLVSVDTIVDQENDFKRSYKIWIKMKNGGKRKHGYLYRLNMHAITICDRNPKNIDSAERSKLVLTIIPDSLILKINIRRNNQVNDAVAGLLSASALAGILGYIVAEDQPDSFFPTRKDQALLAAYLVLTFPAIPVVSLAYIPKSYRIRAQKSAYAGVIRRLERKTRYRVWE